MAPELRDTGISAVGAVPWGTHFCTFYETKQDLLDILVPFFKAGLEGNEFCLWIISNSELLTKQEATSALQTALPDLDSHLSEGHIELVSHDQWFLGGGTFDLYKVAQRFKEKLDVALAKGYVGMRTNGSPAWLYKEDDKELIAFEEEADKVFRDLRLIASCTYPILKSKATELLEVARAHQFVVARRHGEWEVFETPELKQAKAEITRLNEELEERVIERIKELSAANEQLKKEIAERWRAEDRIRLIIDTIPVMAWSLRPDGIVDFLNQRWVDYTGLSLEQYVVDPTGPIHAQDTPRVMENWLAQMPLGEGYDDEMRLRRADGEYRWFLVRTAPLRDESGKVVKWYGVSTDIEDRKRAEETLRKAEERFRALIENSADGISLISSEGAVVYASPAMGRIFGLTMEEVQTLRLDLIHPDDQDMVLNAWNELRATPGKLTSLQYRFRYRDGTWRWLDVTIHSLFSDPSVQALVVNFRDITERKRAEEQLKATSEQLRALSARLQSAREEEATRIAREIHDELGGALTGLRWDLEDLDEVISELSEQSQLESLKKKLAAMMKLTETTVNSVRRIASELRPMILDDLGLIDAIQWQAQQFQARMGITVNCDCPLRNLDLNREKSTAVFRIFQEAMTNIIRHAQATRVDIMIKREAGELVLTIGDNGKGITEGEKSATQSLGLLGMRERAHLIGARIDVTGADGKGTVVTLRVPIRESPKVTEDVQ